jgi:hypothetical protein
VHANSCLCADRHATKPWRLRRTGCVLAGVDKKCPRSAYIDNKICRASYGDLIVVAIVNSARRALGHLEDHHTK